MLREYVAFISYRHGDRDHALCLESALKKYARPIFKPPISIFRDETILTPGEELGDAIRSALARSRFLLYLATKEAAQSVWIQDELRVWCRELGRADHMIIVHVKDTISVNQENNTINWDLTDALPEILSPYVSGIPIWIDLRWATSSMQRDLANLEYRKAVNAIVARFRDLTPGDMNDEEVLAHRRNIRIRNVGLALLTTLAIGVTASSLIAMHNADLALASALVYEANRAFPSDGGEPDLQASTWLALESYEAAPSSEALQALSAAAALLPTPLSLYSIEGTVTDFAFDSTGTTLAAVTLEGSAALWDTRTGEELYRYTGKDSLGRIALTAGGQHILMAGAQTANVGARAVIVDTSTKAPVFLPHSQEVMDIELDNTGKLAVTRTRSDAFLWNVPTGQMQLSVSDGNISFSPDGQLVAAVTNHGDVTVIKVATMEHVFEAEHRVTEEQVLAWRSRRSVTAGDPGIVLNPGSVINLQSGGWARVGEPRTVFSPNSQYLCTAIAGRLKVWDLTTRKEELALSGVEYFDFHPQQLWLAAVAVDKERRQITIWDVSKGEEVRKLSTDRQIRGPFVFSSNGQLLAADRSSGFTIWNTATGRIEGERDTAMLNGSVVFSPGSDLLATGVTDGLTQLWDARSGREVVRLRSFPYKAIAFAANRRFAAFGPEVGGVYSLDVVPKTIRYPPFLDTALSSDGRYWATGGYLVTEGYGIVVLYDTATGMEVKRWAPDKDHDLGFPAEAVVKFGSSGKEGGLLQNYWSSGGYIVRTRSVESNRILSEHASSFALSDLAFVRDNVVGSDTNGNISVINLGNDTESVIIQSGARMNIRGLTGQRAGSSFAAVLDDTTVGVWELASGELIQQARSDKAVVDMKMSSADVYILDTAGRLTRLSLTQKHQKRTIATRGSATVLAVASDGETIAVGGSTTIDIYRGQSPTPSDTLAVGGIVEEAAFSSDGNSLSIVTSDAELEVWDLKKGTRITSVPLKTGTVRGFDIEFSGDGSRLAILDESVLGGVSVVDVGAGKALLSLTSRGEQRTAVALSDHGARVALASVQSDGYRHRLYLWRGTAEEPMTINGYGYATDFALATNAHLVAIAAGTLDANGARVDRVTVWSTVSGKAVAEYPASGGAVRVAITPDGRLVATVSDRNVLSLTALGEGTKPVILYEAQGLIHKLIFSPDSGFIAFAVDESTVRVLDPKEGSLVASVDNLDSINALAFSADSAFLGIATGDVVTIISISTGRIVSRVRKLGGGSLNDIALALDETNGTRLITVSSGLSTVPRVDSTAVTLDAAPWKPNDLVRTACARLTRRLSAEAWLSRGVRTPRACEKGTTAARSRMGRK